MNRDHFLFGFLGTALILDLYISFALRKTFKPKGFFISYWIFHIIYYALLIYGAYVSKPSAFWRHFVLISLAIIYIPKILLALVLFIEDISRILRYGYHAINTQKAQMPSRRKFISQIGLGIASIPFLGILHGILIGKYNYKIFQIKLSFKDLPEAFEGFKIVQISDIHSGSFDDDEKVQYGVDLIKQQKADLFVFTGDLVNSFAKEFYPYVKMFSQIKAPYGQFSIMGNHDYGMYGRLSEDKAETERLLQENDAEFQRLHRETGFTLLKNEMRRIEKDGQYINLIGVENWGASEYFPKAGNLAIASAEAIQGDFNILLSHDPSHFDFTEIKLMPDAPESYRHPEKPIIHFEKKMHLTLSGHTHGAQLGIEIKDFKWSPAKFFYPKWAGLYKEADRYLYVNRGFGFLGFPGRVGIFPEITVITLHKEK